MTLSDPPEQEPLPPSTVPATTQLSLRNLGADSEWNRRFQEALIDLVISCGRFMDLRLLDGVTVGFDYEDALNSVDLGYESTLAREYTNSGGLVGVGKLLRVKRDGEVRAHVVLDANYLGALVDIESAEFLPTANIVAHELAHVAVTSWFEDHSPGVMLAPQTGDWATAVLRDAAHTIWEEYAACRLSAPFSHGETEAARYSSSLSLAVDGAFKRAREGIKSYRVHGDVSQLLIETAKCLTEPLKIAAYLAGHADGIDDQRQIGELCPEAGTSDYSMHWSAFQSALRDAWETRRAWNGLEGVDPIVQVILAVLGHAGAIVTLSSLNQGSRIDVPFSAETMPNGEADMLAFRMRKLLGLE